MRKSKVLTNQDIMMCLTHDLRPYALVEFHYPIFALQFAKKTLIQVTRQTFRYGITGKVYLTKSQKKLLPQLFGDMRFVWNKILERLIKRYKDLRVYAKKNNIKLYNKKHKAIKKNWKKVPKKFQFPKTFGILSKWLTKMKKKHTWLNEADSKALQNQIRTLYETYQKTFKHLCGSPNFKSGKSHYQAWTTNSTTITGNGFLRKHNKGYIPSLGLVNVHLSRSHIQGEVKQVTFELRPNGDFYVSLSMVHDRQALSTNDREVGIDLGREYAIILSDGQKFNRVHNDPKLEHKCQYWQSKANHKRSYDVKKIKYNEKHHPNIEPSYNCRKSLKQFKRYQECRRNHARCSAKLKQRKYDWYQRITTKIAKNYSFIAMENLKVIQMIESKHTIKNAHIMDADWNMITNMLKYKTKKYDDTLILVNPAYTSQICFYDFTWCGKHPVSERYWCCKNTKCYYHKHSVDRDICSAKYILKLARHEVPASVYKQIPKYRHASTQYLKNKFLKIAICSKRTVEVTSSNVGSLDTCLATNNPVLIKLRQLDKGSERTATCTGEWKSLTSLQCY